MPGGRPSKFDQLWKKHQNKLSKLYKAALTDKEVAELLEITEQTINNWKKKHPEFFESLNADKLFVDKDVEASLFQRACGYSCPETKAQWVQDENGGKWETIELTKIYPPDPTSMIFWLKNRKKDEWRDKQEIEHSGKMDVTPKFEEGDRELIKNLMGQVINGIIEQHITEIKSGS